jgi:hypothetical protein
MPPRPRTDAELAAWRKLATIEGVELVEQVADGAPTVAEITRLRRTWSAEEVAAAIELARARVKAQHKWPDRGTLFADVPGIEMASSASAARWKARRFAEHRGTPTLDLCCGIGGDLMALAEAGLEAEGVELDPLRAWMATRNAARPVRTIDAESLDFADTLVHLDPSRRSTTGKRTIRYADITPGPAFVERVAAEARGAAVKLMPGIHPTELPEGEVEYLSENGRLTQAVLWTGVLATNTPTRATMADKGVTFASTSPSEAPYAPLDTLIYAPDPALERAGLLGAFCDAHDLAMPHPHAGILTGPNAIDSPWLARFRLLEDLPWNRKRAKAALQSHNAGIVEVKTRGGIIDTDAEQRALRGSADRLLTLFILRLGDEGIRAIITERG